MTGSVRLTADEGYTQKSVNLRSNCHPLWGGFMTRLTKRNNADGLKDATVDREQGRPETAAKIRRHPNALRDDGDQYDEHTDESESGCFCELRSNQRLGFCEKQQQQGYTLTPLQYPDIKKGGTRLRG